MNQGQEVALFAITVLAFAWVAPAAFGSTDDALQKHTEAVQRLTEAYDSSMDAANPEEVFEENWPIWRAHLHRFRFSCCLIAQRDCESYRRIIGLGPRVVPFVVREYRREREIHMRAMLSQVWMDTSGWGSIPAANPWYKTGLEEWWEGGQALSDERFAEAYAARDLDAILYLGFAALPRLMEKLEGGDHELLDLIARRTRGRADLEGETPEERAAACLAWWEENKQYWLIPFPDREPLQEDEEEEPEG